MKAAYLATTGAPTPPAEQRRCADDINNWLAAKKLHVLIGRTFPLSQTAAAYW